MRRTHAAVRSMVRAYAAALLATAALAAWQDNIEPKRYSKLVPKQVLSFEGNRTHSDHFRLLLPDGNGNLLVGGRNMIYNVSLFNFKVQNKYSWFPTKEIKEKCYMKGGSEEVCQNYIRVLAERGPGQYVACGTNAYEPLCRDLTVQEGELVMAQEFTGRGLCPYGPQHNSTAVYADKELYVGTVADFAGLDPLIYRQSLRSTRFDLATLNAPDFVSSFALGDFVYFFFRETAVEYLNCGKTLYSRVARVCRHDRGGSHKFKNKWTSFLKSRLNCSQSGDFPFYFNEIQATTPPIKGRYGDHATTLLYAVFRTPENSIPGSAVCAFTFQDIMDTFEGPFMEQATVERKWMAVPSTEVPAKRPGQCVKDSSSLPEETVNFIKAHSMMHEAVPAFFGGKPLLVRTAGQRYTAIAVDAQVRAQDGSHYDVLYVGTEDGKVVKALNARGASTYREVESFVIEELTIFSPGQPINSLSITPGTGHSLPRLLAGTGTTVRSVPLVRCHSRSCGECVALRDPYCGWDLQTATCTLVTRGAGLLQSVASGLHQDCPSGDKAPSHSASVNREQDDKQGEQREDKSPTDTSIPSTKSLPLQFTTETLAIAVASAAIGALILGFIAGFFCGRKCHKEEDNQLYAVTDYEYYDQRQTPNSRLTSDMQEEVTYAEPVLLNNHHQQQQMQQQQQQGAKNMNMVMAMASPKAPLKMAPNNSSLPPPPLATPMLQDPLHYAPPESYSTHGTLRTSEKYGTRSRARPQDLAAQDGYATTRSVKKVYL